MLLLLLNSGILVGASSDQPCLKSLTNKHKHKHTHTNKHTQRELILIKIISYFMNQLKN